jgi:hypothetical protein
MATAYKVVRADLRGLSHGQPFDLPKYTVGETIVGDEPGRSGYWVAETLHLAARWMITTNRTTGGRWQYHRDGLRMLEIEYDEKDIVQRRCNGIALRRLKVVREVPFAEAAAELPNDPSYPDVIVGVNGETLRPNTDEVKK